MRLQTTIRFENSLNHRQLQSDFHKDFFNVRTKETIARLLTCVCVIRPRFKRCEGKKEKYKQRAFNEASYGEQCNTMWITVVVCGGMGVVTFLHCSYQINNYCSVKTSKAKEMESERERRRKSFFFHFVNNHSVNSCNQNT